MVERKYIAKPAIILGNELPSGVKAVAVKGDETGKSNRDRVSETLTPDQRARGKGMATRCVESGYKDCE